MIRDHEYCIACSNRPVIHVPCVQLAYHEALYSVLELQRLGCSTVGLVQKVEQKVGISEVPAAQARLSSVSIGRR
jgi:hypothetical protein